MLRILVLVGAMLAMGAAASAHEGKGPHGGTVQDAGKFFVEVIPAGGQLDVYVYDDATQKPVSAKGAHGTATLLAGDKKETVPLSPTGDDNELSGKTTLAATAGVRIVVLVQLEGQPSIVARLSL